jgi:hypothetical protein
MSDEEAHSEHGNIRGESELDRALNRQRSIFLDELETRFSSFSAKRSSPDLGFKFKSEGTRYNLTLIQIELRDFHAFEIFARSAFKLQKVLWTKKLIL